MTHAISRFFAVCLLSLALLALVGCGGDGGAGDDGLKGWGLGGEYDKHYDPKELDRFKGDFVESFEFELPNMGAGLGIVVKDRADNAPVRVHLGPKSFLEQDLKAFGLMPGMKVKVTGVWTEIDGADIFMAAKVKKGEFTQLKVRRTADGYPFWAMTPEELKKERDNEFDKDDEAQPGEAKPAGS